jgi:hypothetical protein
MSDPRLAASYRHKHRGYLDLEWDRFGELCKQLVEKCYFRPVGPEESQQSSAATVFRP